MIDNFPANPSRDDLIRLSKWAGVPVEELVALAQAPTRALFKRVACATTHSWSNEVVTRFGIATSTAIARCGANWNRLSQFDQSS